MALRARQETIKMYGVILAAFLLPADLPADQVQLLKLFRLYARARRREQFDRT